MRGKDLQQHELFSYGSLEQRVPADHPLRPIRVMVDEALKEMSARFDDIYGEEGRKSIPPERLLRALLLQMLYTVRSERMLMVVSEEFFSLIVQQARSRKLLSDEHFTVDGTLIEAWAGHKSFQSKQLKDDVLNPPPPDPGSNPTVNFRKEQRKNDTHESLTDPMARLFKKSRGSESRLAYMGHLLTENRNGLVVDVRLTQATGKAEREAAAEMLESKPLSKKVTLGADRGYDTAAFVEKLRQMNVTPHVAQNTTNRRSAIDERTTRHEGYAVSLRKRKRVEEVFGWLKTVALQRKTRFIGPERTGWMFTFAAAAYNLVRMRNLQTANA
jgi:transposase